MNLLFSAEGRINRAKYWLIYLITFGVDILTLSLMILAVGISATANEDLGKSLFFIFLLFGAFTNFWISLAAMIKRLHDRDKSGWWIFIVLIPILGTIWLFIECGFIRGTEGPNRFGPDPLHRE